MASICSQENVREGINGGKGKRKIEDPRQVKIKRDQPPEAGQTQRTTRLTCHPTIF